MVKFRRAPLSIFAGVFSGGLLLYIYAYTSYRPLFAVLWPIFRLLGSLGGLDTSGGPNEQVAQAVSYFIWWYVYWFFHTIEAVIMLYKVRNDKEDRLLWVLQAWLIGYGSFAMYNAQERRSRR